MAEPRSEADLPGVYDSLLEAVSSLPQRHVQKPAASPDEPTDVSACSAQLSPLIAEAASQGTSGHYRDASRYLTSVGEWSLGSVKPSRLLTQARAAGARIINASPNSADATKLAERIFQHAVRAL
jgi:hypothetical protein